MMILVEERRHEDTQYHRLNSSPDKALRLIRASPLFYQVHFGAEDLTNRWQCQMIKVRWGSANMIPTCLSAAQDFGIGW